VPGLKEHLGRKAGKGSKAAHRTQSFWGRLGVLVLIPFVVYTIYSVAEKSMQTYRLRQEVAAIRQEVEAEKRENLRLQQELVDARSDQQIEDSARRYLNLVRPGDHAVVLNGPLPQQTPTPTSTVARSDPPDDAPIWFKWLMARLGQ
jgi:cell division protein FtsL